MVNRVVEYFRPAPPPPELVADTNDIVAIAGAILYWGSVRDRAFAMGHYSLGRMAAGLADEHARALDRLRAEADWACSNCGSPIPPAGN